MTAFSCSLITRFGYSTRITWFSLFKSLLETVNSTFIRSLQMNSRNGFLQSHEMLLKKKSWLQSLRPLISCYKEIFNNFFAMSFGHVRLIVKLRFTAVYWSAISFINTFIVYRNKIVWFRSRIIDGIQVGYDFSRLKDMPAVYCLPRSKTVVGFIDFNNCFIFASMYPWGYLPSNYCLDKSNVDTYTDLQGQSRGVEWLKKDPL